MGLPKAGGKQFQQTPPDKGSFPLDHEGECRAEKTAYMDCLKQNDNNARLCRAASKVYLECRMAKSLMAKEDLKSLGFRDDATAKPSGPK